MWDGTGWKSGKLSRYLLHHASTFIMTRTKSQITNSTFDCLLICNPALRPFVSLRVTLRARTTIDNYTGLMPKRSNPAMTIHTPTNWLTAGRSRRKVMPKRMGMSVNVELIVATMLVAAICVPTLNMTSPAVSKRPTPSAKLAPRRNSETRPFAALRVTSRSAGEADPSLRSG